MPTTTSYGSWGNHSRHYATPEDVLSDFVNGAGAEWHERAVASGAFARMADDYRAAVNAALPDGVSLHGTEFYGPYNESDRTWTGQLDIAAIIDAVDLSAIVERHDPDNT